MKILHVASEVAPWSETGGLAQVVGALGAPLARAAAEVRCAVASPLYRGIAERVRASGLELIDRHIEVSVVLDGRRLAGRFVSVEAPEQAPVHFLDCPELYDRDGIYGDSRGDFGDNSLRFAMLCRGAIDASERLLGGAPDVLHAHDWQAGLVPVYLQRHARGWLPDTRAVFTIHNLAYQGVFPKSTVESLDLGWAGFHLNGFELYDQVSFLKAGVAFADATTTVSPTYAREMLTPKFGCNLDDFLAHGARGGVLGILNGIDTRAWNPAADPHLPATFDADDLAGKAVCRQQLLQEMGLKAAADELVLGVVSRFAEQKGMDLVAELASQLYSLGARLVVLGSGEAALEARFRQLGDWFGDHLAVRLGYVPALAHRIYAGADAVLVPSRFEPCGLAQLYAMRYGALPIASAVGGLADTVVDPGDAALLSGQGNGFCFQHPTADGLRWAVERAARLFRREPRGWKRITARAMRHDVSWASSAAGYLQLYQRLSIHH